MMSKSFKKMLAGMLALTMVLGMSMTALADTGTLTGSGQTESDGTFEGHVDKNVVSVMLPTVAEESDVFAFTMDPEGLIVATANQKYPDATFTGDTGVYFLTATNTYTANSAKLKVTNMGTVDVDVTLTAQATVDSTITVKDNSNFTGADAGLYLGLVIDGTVSAGDAVATLAVNSTEDGDASKTVVGLKGRDANYEVSVSGNDYVYAKKDGVSATAWNSFTFGLTGACDKNANWEDVSTENTSVTVTWAYAKADAANAASMLRENAVSQAAPSIDAASYAMRAQTPVVISVDLGAGDLAATKATSCTINGIEILDEEDTYATYENGKITIKADTVDYLLSLNLESSDCVITFNDTNTTEIEFTLVTAAN